MKNIILVEGLIGAGKSTLISMLREDKNIKDKCVFVSEPIDEFCMYKSIGGKVYNPLKEQYENTKNFPIVQMHITNSLYKQYENFENEEKLYICERSILSPITFINTSYDLKNITEYTKDVLSDMVLTKYKGIKEEIKHIKLFYLDTNVELCLERIGYRSREGENQIDLHFLQTLQKNYKEYIPMLMKNLKIPNLRVTHETDKDKLVHDFKDYIKDLL